MPPPSVPTAERRVRHAAERPVRRVRAAAWLDARAAGRTLAAVYLGGAVIGALSAATMRPGRLGPTLLTLAAGLAVGLMSALGPVHRLRPGWLDAAMATGTLLVGAGILADAVSPGVGVLLFLSVTPFAFWCRSLRRGLAQLCVVAAGYAGVLALEDPLHNDAAAHWLLGVGGVVAVSLLVHALARSVDAERRRSETDRALTDSLTGLPNRALMTSHLEHALARSERGADVTAVLFLGVDDFKLVNDAHGHEAGDALLALMAPRLRDAVRNADVVSRFGGDEFVVVCERLGGEEDAMAIAERVRDALSTPFLLPGGPVHAAVGIGIAVSTGASGTAESLLRDADDAMMRAKERGRGETAVFDESLRSRLLQRMRLETELRDGIERGELRLAYQPVVSLVDGAVHAVEALVRWEHPERGLLGPGGFVPVAEDSGLIQPLGRWVLREACREAATWNEGRTGLPVPVFVNLSARQVAHGDVVDVVRDALAGSGLRPELLGLEITESILLDEAENPERTLHELKALGVSVVLDDFGTGYSSLSYLTRFPLDGLKLDRSFASSLGGREAAAIVAAVVQMGRSLELPVVAEGIEESEQLGELLGLGCSLVQGFLFARPLASEDIRALLETQDPWQSLLGEPRRVAA